MTDIIAGNTYRRTDREGAVTQVDWISSHGDIIGHTYVPGGTVSTACVISLDRFKMLVEPQN